MLKRGYKTAIILLRVQIVTEDVVKEASTYSKFYFGQIVKKYIRLEYDNT